VLSPPQLLSPPSLGSVDLLGVNHYYRSLVSWGVASESDAPPSPSDLFLKLVGARL